MKQNKITLGTARSWPRPINRGGLLKEAFIEVYGDNFSGNLATGHQIKVGCLVGGLLIELPR